MCMNKSLIYSLFFLMLFFSCSQQKMEKEFYPNGRLKFEVPIIKGKRHGKSVQYYENGKVQLISNWENGIKKGESTSFYKNGNPHIKSTYKNGVANGIIQIYDSLHNIKEKYTVINELKDGPYQEFFPDGRLKVEGSYKNDKPEGKGFEFYETGELFRKYVYKNGELIYFKSYSKEGNLYDCKLPIELTYSEIGIEIKLAYTEFDSARIGVIIGRLDANKHLIDTIEVLGSKDLKYIYEVDEGKKYFSGVLYEIKMPENRIEGQYFFESPAGASL